MKTHGAGSSLVLKAAGLGLAAAVGLLGCSGGTTGTSGSMSTGSTGSTSSTMVQVNLGDAPADWMLAFSMNISSMSLTGASGSTAVISSPVTMEMMHLMGTMQPLSMVKVPQGTYTGATITIGSATVMYMDPTSKTAVQKTISGPISGTMTFSTPVTVGSTPVAMGFDLNLASSVTVDSSGNMTMKPVFQATSGLQGSGNTADPADGGIQQMMGVVSGVNGTSFGMTPMQAAQGFTFSTNGSTVFSGTSMGSMMNGMVALVDATMQADGSLLATKVQMMGSTGAMGGGILTAVSGAPPSTFTMVMQDAAGTGMMSSMFAEGTSVTSSGSTTYSMDTDGMNMTGLPFTPTFDANHVYEGQSVMPVASAGMMTSGMGGTMMGGSPMAGNMTASQMVLEQQGLSGTTSAAINSGTSGSFTLTLPVGAAFTTLTGATSVLVFQQQTTAMASSQMATGSTAHVFGLLFFDGGQWKMVASRIS